MKAIYRVSGDSIEFEASADIPAGSLIIKNSLVGITKMFTKEGDACVLSTRGVFSGADKGAGAMAFGQIVYADTDGKIYGVSAAGRIPCGYAVESADTADTTCTVFLMPSVQPAEEA